MNNIKLTARQQEIFQEIQDKWIYGEGLKIRKKNALTINNLKRLGLVELYPSVPGCSSYISLEAFPVEEYR